MDYIVQTSNLTKRYKKKCVLNNVCMNVPKGSIYGFVGKNGAGKTTLMRIICGLAAPTQGSYSLYGVDRKSSEITAFRKKIGAVVETPSIYLDLTAEENLLLQYKLHGMEPTGMKDLLALVGLPDTGKKKAKDFSLGMRQRLSIAFSLIAEPEFLVLDEPINGLDPAGIVEVRELLLKLSNERGITILISSHILEELSKLATHYGFIDNGNLIKEMSHEELINACESYTHVRVSDIQIFTSVMQEMNIKHAILPDYEAKIYSKFEVTPLVLALADKGCNVISMTKINESLESYFIKLIGGAHNA